MNFHANDILTFLLEADEEISSEKSTDVADVKEKSDLAADKKDTDNSSDVTDTDEDSTEDEGDDALDDMDASDDGDNETSDNSNDDDETTSPPHEDDSRFNGEKLVLYAALKEVKVSFESVLAAFDIMVAATIPKENLATFKEIKKKVTININLLNEFLNDIDDIHQKKLKELKQIYRIYLNDLKMIDSVLKSYSVTNKNK